MKKKKVKIKYQNIFNLLSFLFLMVLCCIYGYRFLHYHALAKKKSIQVGGTIEDVYTTITTANLHSNSVKLQDDLYHFEGKDANNYLYYSGNLWRIISFSQEEVTLISEMPVTALPLFGHYQNSSIAVWLKEKYYPILDKEYLKATKTCASITEANLPCTDFIEEEVSIPSLSIYNLTGGVNSFMNNGYYMYFSDEANNYYYMDVEGKIHEEKDVYHFGVKPVITIQNTNVLEGNGTKDHPYKVSTPKTNLKEVAVGSYIEYSGYKWRILENTNAVKMMATEPITKQTITSEIYNPNTGLGSYLNTTFYNTLQKDFLLLGIWNVGRYDGVTILKNEKNAYVGLPQIDDVYLYDGTTYALSNQTVLEETFYAVEKDGRITQKEVGIEYEIKPVIHIQNDVEVIGDGSALQPYQIVGETE